MHATSYTLLRAVCFYTDSGFEIFALLIVTLRVRDEVFDSLLRYLDLWYLVVLYISSEVLNDAAVRLQFPAPRRRVALSEFVLSKVSSIDVRLHVVDDHVEDECFCEARLCAFAEHEPCELAYLEIEEVMHVCSSSRSGTARSRSRCNAGGSKERSSRSAYAAPSCVPPPAPFSGSSVLPRLSEPLLSVAGR